jgi:hypothetical protein
MGSTPAAGAGSADALGYRLVMLAWLGLVECLVHAWFDFPFQIHSILFLFLVICAILFSMGRKSGASRR